jgi:hypothetical protein
MFVTNRDQPVRDPIIVTGQIENGSIVTDSNDHAHYQPKLVETSRYQFNFYNK